MSHVFATMTCSITATLAFDTMTGRFLEQHAAAPVCAEWTAESIAVAAGPRPQQQPPPRLVDLVTYPRPVDNTPPPMPWIQKGICPDGHCEVGPWTACSTLVATRDQRHNSPAIFTVRPGEGFTALTGEVHVTKPGLVVFRNAFTEVLEKQDAAGPVVTIVRFTPADTLYPLLYLTDRQMVLWFRGAADTGADFWRPDPAVYRPDALKASRLIEPPVTTWWIRIRNSRGQEGWALYNLQSVWRAATSREERADTCRTEAG